MKQLFIIATIAIGLTSCKDKCYHCNNNVSGQYHSEVDYCEGVDHQYDALENGVTLTDYVGNPYECEHN